MTEQEKFALGYKPYRKTALAWAKVATEDGSIETLEGVMEYKAGDYLCIGVENEQWPVKKSIFESSYEIVPWGNG